MKRIWIVAVITAMAVCGCGKQVNRDAYGKADKALAGTLWLGQVRQSFHGLEMISLEFHPLRDVVRYWDGYMVYDLEYEVLEKGQLAIYSLLKDDAKALEMKAPALYEHKKNQIVKLGNIIADSDIITWNNIAFRKIDAPATHDLVFGEGDIAKRSGEIYRLLQEAQVLPGNIGYSRGNYVSPFFLFAR